MRRDLEGMFLLQSNHLNRGDDVENPSSALINELEWEVNQGIEYDNVVGIVALNTVYGAL